MKCQQSTYSYVPLDKYKRQIRLLHLHSLVDGLLSNTHDPGYNARGANDIYCTFSVASLDDPPSYDALSYVWGDAKEVSEIILDGQSFLVTRNLQAALYQVRQTQQTRTLWVDALCINQDDVHERSDQVSQMQHIYSQASTVLVSLGTAWEGSDAVIDFIELIGSNTALHFNISLEPSTKSYGIDFKSKTLQDSLLKFFYLP